MASALSGRASAIVDSAIVDSVIVDSAIAGLATGVSADADSEVLAVAGTAAGVGD